MLKKISIAILLLNIFTNNKNLSSSLNSNEIEAAVALLKTPAIMAKNSQYFKPNSKSSHFLNLSVDALRLINEILSVVNDDGEFEYHKYDYAWAIYDAASLITHFKDLFMKSEDTNQNSQEIKKFDGLILEFHKKIFPIAEGLTALVSAVQIGNTIKDAHIRLECKSLNSAIRLLDNIVTCKNKSTEQILYAVALVISIVVSIKDLYEINNIEDARLKEKLARRRANEERIQKNIANGKAFLAAEAARLEKIRDEECKRKQAENAQIERQEKELEYRARNRPINDPAKLAWDEVDRKKAKAKVLRKSISRTLDDIDKIKQKASDLRFNSNSSYATFSPVIGLSYPHDSPLGRHMAAEENAKRIGKFVALELEKKLSERRLSEALEPLEEALGNARTKYREALGEASYARKYALQVAKDNMVWADFEPL